MAAPTIDGFKAEAARVGVTGRIDIAEVGSPAPRDMANLDSLTHTNLGYISDDGVTENRDEDNEEFTPWQENSPIRIEITKSTVSFEFTLWQSTAATAGFYFGVSKDDMFKNADGSVYFEEGGKPDLKRNQVVLTVVDGEHARRIVLANAQVTERQEISYKSDEMIGYGVTVTGYPGPDGWSARRIFAENWDDIGEIEDAPEEPVVP
ncbi:hypothetical protein L5I01_17500 [Gordonia sp. HY442]|uniref:phage tail tube protein n=1 Tax=Gordonia zhenghanii TaxID=2911516 RepID=UPI001F19621A|nr:hypothetical protein [Gordonia zhenghanii]MCF8605153.1 hypothetical protein [Gordonia zhenghanii]